MIQRFNFYDLYGYFLPGSALIFFLWLPYGITERFIPEVKTSDALAAVVAAYLLGVILHSVSSSIVSSKTMSGRFPSDAVVDDTSTEIDADTRKLLAKRIQDRFKLDVQDRATRNTAFLRCRTALIHAKQSEYAQQMEGMYALMRGVSCAAAAGAFYIAGWIVKGMTESYLLDFIVDGFVLLMLLGAILAFWNRPADDPDTSRSLAAALAMIAALAGYAVAARVDPKEPRWGELLFAALLLTMIALRAHAAYRKFTIYFARTVYLDFLHLKTDSAPAVAP
jgi:hypothetical protein